MGLDARVYVGPYFRCMTPIVEKSEQSNLKACPNPACTRHNSAQDGKFCSSCATVMESFTVKRKVAKITESMVRDALTTEDALNCLNNPNGPIIKPTAHHQFHIWVGESWPNDISTAPRFLLDT